MVLDTMQPYLPHRLARNPISLVGINERTITTLSIDVPCLSASCNARYKDTNVLPVPAHQKEIDSLSLYQSKLLFDYHVIGSISTKLLLLISLFFFVDIILSFILNG